MIQSLALIMLMQGVSEATNPGGAYGTVAISPWSGRARAGNC